MLSIQPKIGTGGYSHDPSSSVADGSKFVADESMGRAKRGAVFSTVGGVVDGASRQIKTYLSGFCYILIVVSNHS